MKDVVNDITRNLKIDRELKLTADLPPMCMLRSEVDKSSGSEVTKPVKTQVSMSKNFAN